MKLATTRTPATTNTEKTEVQIVTATSVTESNTQTQQIQTQGSLDVSPTTATVSVSSNLESTTTSVQEATTETMATVPVLTTSSPTTTTAVPSTITMPALTTTTEIPTTTTTTQAPTTTTMIATTTMTTAVPMTSTPSTTTTMDATTTTTTPAPTTTTTTTAAPTTITTTMPLPTTTPTTNLPTTASPSAMTIPVTTTLSPTTTNALFTTTVTPIITGGQATTISIEEDLRKYQEDLQLLQTLLQATGRDPKNLNLKNNPNSLLSSQTTTISSPTTKVPVTAQSIDQAQLLQVLLSMAGQKPKAPSVSNSGSDTQSNGPQSTTFRSIEDDIKQFEEDTKLLKALLQITGQNPSSLNIPTLDNIRTTTSNTPTATTPTTTTTTSIPTTTFRQTTTQTVAEDLKQLQEDAKFLQALLKATGQNTGNLNLPIVSGVTSNVRIASNPQTTSIMSNPTTPIEIRPVYTTTQTPIFTTFAPRTVSPTLQPAVAFSTVTENVGISTTFAPFTGGMTTTFRNFESTTVPSAQAPNSRFTVTTDIPSTSTFSVEEDLAFLQNLVSFL